MSRVKGTNLMSRVKDIWNGPPHLLDSVIGGPPLKS